MAVGLVLVTLEMGRRAVKWILPAVALLTIAYGVFGDLLPDRFGHPGFPLPSFLGTLTIAEGGGWGPLTGISVDVGAGFVHLGSVGCAGEAGRALRSGGGRLGEEACSTGQYRWVA